MKKFHFLAIAFFSVLIYSCSKEKDEIAKPEPNAAQKENRQPDNNVPHFDEKNSKQITWDQLPSELKNATPIETTKELKLQDAKGNKTAKLSGMLYSYYSYAVGTWGGGGGSPFYIYPPSGSRIYAMAIRAGAYVDRITIWYRRADGSIYMGGDRGGTGGSYYLQYFAYDEYIYYVNGRSGGYLDRLGIYTNKKYFSYGGWGGSPFGVGVPSGYQILGFYGGSGSLIDRIGFYVYTR